jgi:hypothetical protein
MPLNIGITGGPPRKKSGLPPKVGEKPHMAVMIAAIPKGGPGPSPGGDDGDDGPAPRPGGSPFPRAAGRKLAPPSARPGPAPSARSPAPPAGLDGGGADHPILPEAVNYRSEQETCQNCVHMQDDGECERLHIPVSEGDGCNLFADSSGRDADESAEQYEPEEAGEEEEENAPAYR